MGSVKIDVDKADRNYYSTSLSSEEDILEILHTLDAMKKDVDKGNYEALAVVLDFEKLFLRNDVCREYHTTLIGDSPFVVQDYGKNILDLVSERLNIPKQQCEDILYNSINEMIEENKELWLNWVNKNFKGKIKVKKNRKSQLSTIDDSSFYQTDFNRKYIVNNKMYKELGYPSDLQELIDVQKKNQNRIDELNSLKKAKKITKELREELRKRIRFNIGLWEDINILKKHYGIQIQNNMVKEKVKIVSYSENDLDIEDYQTDNDFIIDEWQLHRIKETASDVLTDKQLVIFNLYYISGLTQQQIADLINETRGHISRDLKISLEKIRKNL